MAAVALIVVIGAALTPLVSPYRLAANSQYQLILRAGYAQLAQRRSGESPFAYLAFQSGNYGRTKLQRLTTLQGRADAGPIRNQAAQALKQFYPWQLSISPADSREVVAKLPLYPTGRTLDADLSQRLTADWSRYNPLVGAANVAQTTAGVFVDLDGDGVDEFVLLSAGGGPVYQSHGGHWGYVGRLYPEGMTLPWPALVKELSGGSISAVAPPWKNLALGDHRYRMLPQPY
jgi:hypothetical protein